MSPKWENKDDALKATINAWRLLGEIAESQLIKHLEEEPEEATEGIAEELAELIEKCARRFARVVNVQKKRESEATGEAQ